MSNIKVEAAIEDKDFHSGNFDMSKIPLADIEDLNQHSLGDFLFDVIATISEMKAQVGKNGVMAFGVVHNGEAVVLSIDIIKTFDVGAGTEVTH